MRSSFCALVVAACAAATIAVSPTAAKADVMTFDIYGTIDYTHDIAGTFLIDTTTGAFLSADLQYQGMNFNIGEAAALEDHDPDRPVGYVIGLNTADSGSYPYLSIILPQDSLIGYEGGVVCHNMTPDPGFVESNCPAAELISFYDSDEGADEWTAGYIEPAVSATPEPSTLVLLGTCALGLLGIGSRKLWSRS